MSRFFPVNQLSLKAVQKNTTVDLVSSEPVAGNTGSIEKQAFESHIHNFTKRGFLQSHRPSRLI